MNEIDVFVVMILSCGCMRVVRVCEVGGVCV